MRTDVLPPEAGPTAGGLAPARGSDGVALALSAAAAVLAAVAFAGVLFYVAGSRNASQLGAIFLRAAAGVGGVAVLVVLWVRIAIAWPAGRGGAGPPPPPRRLPSGG